MRIIFPFLLIPFLLIAGCTPAQATPGVNAISTQSVATAYAELTRSALPTVTPTLPPISESTMPAECLQLDGRLSSDMSGRRENTVPWTKSVSCHFFALSQDNQYLAYVHSTYNDSPEVDARCKSVTKGTPEQCRADVGLVETVKVLDISTGEIRSLQTAALLPAYLVFMKLEWLATGELRYRLGNTEGPSFDQIYDPATGLVSAITPTPFPTPVSPLPVQVKEQVYAGEIAWSPDSQTLAVSSCYAGCRLELLKPADLSQLWNVELNAMATDLRFSPSGETIAASLDLKSYETEIWLFNAQDGAVIQQIKLDGGHANGFEISPNGENIAVLVDPEGDVPNEIWLLDAQDGITLSKWGVDTADALGYSPSGDMIVTTGDRLALWNVSNGGRRWKLDPGAVTSQNGNPCEVERFDQAMFNQDQSFLLARALGKNPDMEADCSYMLSINLKTGQFISLQNEPNPDGPGNVLYFNDDTSELIFFDSYPGLRRWNINTSEVILVEDTVSHLGTVFIESAAQPNQARLAISTEIWGGAVFPVLYLYDISSEQWFDLFPSEYVNQEAYVTSLAFSPDGRWLSAVNEDGRLMVWDIPYIPSVAATAEPNSTPTPLPPAVFTCPLAPKSRLNVGDNARIAFTTGQTTRLRSAPEAGDNVITMLPEGTEFKIIDGPVCYPRPGRNDAYVYWKVSVTSNSQEGWLAEGDSDSYYIEPY
jgi:WD40 repeat protein